jgi:phospholipid transport system substrate-binding protein
MRTPGLIPLFALLLVGITRPGIAASPDGPSAFVSEMVPKAILSMTNDTSTPNDRQKRLTVFLDKDFDMPQIASFVLGHYWQKASESDRQNFTVAYRNFMARIYAQRFTGYSGESFRVIDEKADSATSSTTVNSEMRHTSADEPLKVAWRVTTADGFRVVDISVAGISMAQVQREDFGAYLQQNGGNLSALIQMLETKTTAME